MAGGGLTPPLPLAEAQARLLGAAAPLGVEWIAVAEGAGRWLAEPLVALRTQPPADLSAMDGYAVRADELRGPWRVVGESAAGHPFPRSLAPDEAIRISTGAQMPSGSGAVLLQEDATCEGDRLRIVSDDGPAARHIRRAGFDFRTGDELLAAGTLLGPAQVALALIAGAREVKAHRLAAIAVIDSGDELAAEPEKCPSHQIPASNAAMIGAMAAPLANRVERMGPVPDRQDALVAALEQASRADVIVTSGGASVGDHDLIRPALEEWGASIDFWRVAVRPGKPLIVARKGEQWILGLPGNPVSSFVTAFLFLLPLLRRLGGADQARALPQAILARLGAPLPKGGGRSEFVRGILSQGIVHPVDERDSSALRALASSNALIERAPGAAPATVGDTVPVLRLQSGGIA